MSIFDRFLVGRREFLLSTGASVIATATLGPQIFAASAPSDRLAVGFAHLAGTSYLVDAATIPGGDGTFIRTGTRVAVSGSGGAKGDPALRRITELRSYFSYFEGGEIQSAPFLAWSASRATGGQGSPIRFTVPVDQMQKLSFSLRVGPDEPQVLPTSRRRAARGAGGATAAAGPRDLPLTLSLQNEPGAFPLLRGYYVVVPLSDRESTPDWSRYRLFLVDGRWSLLDGSGAPALFEHFVLNVAYQTP